MYFLEFKLSMPKVLPFFEKYLVDLGVLNVLEKLPMTHLDKVGFY